MVGIYKTHFKQTLAGLHDLLGAQTKASWTRGERRNGKHAQLFLNRVASHIPQLKNRPSTDARHVVKGYISYIGSHRNEVNDLLSAKQAHQIFKKISRHVKDADEKQELERAFHNSLNTKMQRDLHEYMQQTPEGSKPSSRRRASSSTPKLSKKRVSTSAKKASLSRARTTTKTRKTVASAHKKTMAPSIRSSHSTKAKQASTSKAKRAPTTAKKSLGAPNLESKREVSRSNVARRPQAKAGKSLSSSKRRTLKATSKNHSHSKVAQRARGLKRQRSSLSFFA